MDDERPVLVITGAAGFIGRALRQELHRGYLLLAIDKQPLAASFEGEVACVLDLETEAGMGAVEELLRNYGQRVGAWIHLAAYYDFSNRPHPSYGRLTAALAKILELFGAHTPATARFIFASSMAALAPSLPGQKIGPESPRLGLWQYPRSKLDQEAILDRCTMSQPIIQLVLAAVYSDYGELVPLFHQIQLIAGWSPEKFFYPGPTAHGLSYVHVEDAARAFASAVRAELPASRVRLLVGEAEPTSYHEICQVVSLKFRKGPIRLITLPKAVTLAGAYLISWLCRLLGRRRFIQPWMIPFAGEHFPLDTEATLRVLGWQPRHRFKLKLEEILQHRAREFDEWLRLNLRRPW